MANAVSTQSETEADWAELLTYTCNDKGCNGCSNLTFTNSPKSQCQIVPSENESAQEKSEDFCEQISQLLATTLDGSQASFEVKSEAIETAMQMVAEKTLADAELQINELKIAHQKQVDQLENQLLEAKDQRESIDQVLSWLRPIYFNQNRNYQHLQQLTAAKNQPIPYRLPQVENTERYGKDNRTAHKFDRSLVPSSAKMASKSLAENREAEIAKLKQELQRIDSRLSKLVNQSENQFEDKAVQTVNHLQPVYVPNEKLVPIPNAPERHSALRRLAPTQRPNRNR